MRQTNQFFFPIIPSVQTRNRKLKFGKASTKLMFTLVGRREKHENVYQEDARLVSGNEIYCAHRL